MPTGRMFPAMTGCGVHFRLSLLSIAELRSLPEQELPKGRDAAESLILSVWALLNSGTYLETLSKLPAGEGGAALATIAGGLAGCCFGLSRLPEQGRLQIQLTADGKGLLGGFVRNWRGAEGRNLSGT